MSLELDTVCRERDEIDACGGACWRTEFWRLRCAPRVGCHRPDHSRPVSLYPDDASMPSTTDLSFDAAQKATGVSIVSLGGDGGIKDREP